MAEDVVCKPICSEHFMSKKTMNGIMVWMMGITLTISTSCVAWAMATQSTMSSQEERIAQHSKDIADIKIQFKSIDSKLDLLVITTTQNQEILKGKRTVTR